MGCFIIRCTDQMIENQQQFLLIVQTYSEDEVKVVLERAVEQYTAAYCCFLLPNTELIITFHLFLFSNGRIE